MLSTVVNALVDAGLDAERLAEPPAPVPTYLLVAVPPPLTGRRASPDRLS